ncbi:I78 family peptidase inhibitor [Phaeovulum vinaykumarii]|nr:I78 family peptidase inhibitor [Phaeovulum vinaykumarii]
MKRFAVIAMLGGLMLAGCAEPTPPEPIPYQPITPPPTIGTPLEERTPDTCHAADHQAVMGQPAAVIPTLGLTRPVRVVEWGGIEDQIYNPQRIVFRLDPAGNIAKIDCG